MFVLYSTIAAIAVLVKISCWTGAGATATPESLSPAPTGLAACSPVCLTADETLAVQILNEERSARGLACLELDPVLVQVAREHSLDMAQRGYFDHLAPTPAPTTPLDRYAAALGHQPSGLVGENIGHAPQPLMAVIHNQMMESPEHKANITDVEYVRVGIGIFTTPDGRVWITQMFAG